MSIPSKYGYGGSRYSSKRALTNNSVKATRTSAPGTGGTKHPLSGPYIHPTATIEAHNNKPLPIRLFLNRLLSESTFKVIINQSIKVCTKDDIKEKEEETVILAHGLLTIFDRVDLKEILNSLYPEYITADDIWLSVLLYIQHSNFEFINEDLIDILLELDLPPIKFIPIITVFGSFDTILRNIQLGTIRVKIDENNSESKIKFLAALHVLFNWQVNFASIYTNGKLLFNNYTNLLFAELDTARIQDYNNLYKFEKEIEKDIPHYEPYIMEEISDYIFPEEEKNPLSSNNTMDFVQAAVESKNILCVAQNENFATFLTNNSDTQDWRYVRINDPTYSHPNWRYQ